MTKKMNIRAHKKALKKATRKNNRNIYYKEQKKNAKKLAERFDISIWIDDLSANITKMKTHINVALANFKYQMQKPLFERKLKGDEKTTLEDIIREFASAENISFAFAMVILCNCLVSVNSYASSVQGDDVALSQKSDVSSFSQEDLDGLHSQINDHLSTIDTIIPMTSLGLSESMEKLEEIEIIIEELDEPVLTDEDRLLICLDKYSVTETQFKEVIATCLLEGGWTLKESVFDENGNRNPDAVDHYNECKNVASTIFNRAGSASCIRFVDKYLGPGTGVNIYNQVICPGQYTVSRSEVQRLAQTDLSVYVETSGIIEVFYESAPTHNYYRFYDYKRKDLQARYNGVQLNPPFGNCYHTEVQEYDRVDLADTLPNYSKYMVNDEPDAQETMNAEERAKTLTLKPSGDLTQSS